MQWVLLAIAAIALIAASTRYPRFAFGTLVILVVLAVILYRLTSGERERGRTMIEPAELTVSNVSIREGYADSYVFNGRIRNGSASASLVEFELRLAMLDCPAAGDTDGNRGEGEDPCTVIGEQIGRVTIDVPPHQVRDFSETFHFGTVRPIGRLDWRHDITGVIAREHPGAR